MSGVHVLWLSWAPRRTGKLLHTAISPLRETTTLLLLYWENTADSKYVAMVLK